MAEYSGDSVAVAIVVVNYNSHDLLRRYLAACRLELTPARIIVVDNSDAPDEISATAALCSELSWVLVPAGGNVGFGAGVNLGVERAIDLGASEFIILNPDAWIDVSTARSLAGACASRPLEAVSPVVRRPDGTAWFSGGAVLMHRGRVRTNVVGEVEGPPWLTGAVLGMSRELWQRVGGFDERFFLYWEDVDLSWRILEVGGQVRVARELHAHHSVGGTQQGSNKSAAFVFYNSRNRLLFAGLHLNARQRLDWLLGTPRLTWELIGLGGRSSQAFRAGLSGVAAGLPRLLGVMDRRQLRRLEPADAGPGVSNAGPARGLHRIRRRQR